jgi:hypothetical protein
MMGRDGDEFWRAIQNNIDAILTFFHILMTRDRIPLIDYGKTFMSRLHEWLDPSILLRTSAASAYPEIKRKAIDQLSTAVLKFPCGKSLNLDRELLAVGYFWRPNLEGLPIMPEAIAAAQFVLGGMIFGEYAAAGGADHVLQSKRLDMMTGLDEEPRPISDDWRIQERALFAELAKLTNRDKTLRKKNEVALPNVLLHLLAKGIKSPRALLDDALKHNQGPANLLAIATWRNCFGYVASAERYQDPLRDP